MPKHLVSFAVGCLFGCLFAEPVTAAEIFLVEEGRARAEIVLAPTPLRTTRLAAQELQTYVEKISGARLPIVLRPTGGELVPIFVGVSPDTAGLGLSADDLRDGAYRIVSGKRWLALLGEDTEFQPPAPWARNNAEIVNGTAQRPWEQIVGGPYGLPNVLIYKNRMSLPGDTGLPDALRAEARKKPLEIWSHDERGSFNAVCGWLQRLGVRWYAPGELGEVVPKQASLTLPAIDETVRPDFAMRRFNVRFAVHSRDVVFWAMHLGERDPYPIQAAHGMDLMTNREEVYRLHPEWFGLYGGKRRFEPGQNNQLCYSNEELFRETVRYVRAQFDHFRLDAVSVMPPDGYTAVCQCPHCRDLDSPERDARGLLSDYVWEFVNRVAKEVGKTHPKKFVLNCAYGAYTLPPEKIAKLEPNVLVSIVGARRPMSDRPEEQADLRALREAWSRKTDNPIVVFENYPFTDRGWYLPSFTTQTLGAGINAVKGAALGEDIWLSMRQDFDQVGIGFNHFLVYFTQRMYWGGAKQEIGSLFEEYCRLFYGPAAVEMRAFFQFCEANWREMERDKALADRALELFAAAQAKAEPSGVYGRRLAWMDEFLKGLRSKSAQLGKKRGPVPVLRLVGSSPGKIVIDGKLDDEAWVKAFPSATCSFRELQTGRSPTFGTTVKTAWIGNDLYFAFHCAERPGDKPNDAAGKEDDSSLWYGDVVEVLLETDARAYYQIAVGPSGTVVDLDRSADRHAWFGWDSQAEVATSIADDHWIVEMRIPITADENDPLHQVIGHRPTRSLPWYVNLCRQRVRDGATEWSGFSPTGADNFHVPMKFAHLFDGNSFQFDAAEPEDDFLAAVRRADELVRTGKREAALEAYLAAGAGPFNDFQKSHALECAATSARAFRKFDLAEEIAARIPLDAVRKAVRMENDLEQGRASAVVAQFDGENLDAWPFWKRADGYFARGRARSAVGRGDDAEADLSRALPYASEPRVRDAIHLARARNLQNVLRDDSRALAAYRAIIDGATHLGSADQFYAVQDAARLLVRQGKFDAAAATLGRVDVDALRGFWQGSLLLTSGDVHAAAGRPEQAKTAYRRVLTEPGADPRLRATAEERLRKLAPASPAVAPRQPLQKK